MTKGRHLLAGMAALAALVVSAPLTAAAAQPQPPVQAVKIMPLGDSITDGFNVPGGYRIELWQEFVAGNHNVDFVGSLSNGPSSLGDRNHEGHSGWTISQIDGNIVAWLDTYDPRTILLHIGTNDMILGDPAAAASRLSTLIDHITAQSPDAELFVATIIPLPFADAAVRAFNAQIPAIVQSKVDAGMHVHLVDMYSALTPADLADGVHPNATGYAKMAAAWYDALLSVPGSLSPLPEQPADRTAAGPGRTTSVLTMP